ncbi:hypothetical protein SAMN05444365_10860 [Micromonospora pattaloongensis]|uniref:Uncharacterized protein n=1 Tax=Micromonospora pattaloongensis TaxID=405436 RepID=A0A1H3RHU3_9ACTN|nr:hypothetical protein SAMN05444365_10860 [Micromonospora pattaloongensis]
MWNSGGGRVETPTDPACHCLVRLADRARDGVVDADVGAVTVVPPWIGQADGAQLSPVG